MRTSNLGWRRGQIIVLAPFMVSVLGGVVAITADVGHMFVEKALLQNTADGAALAATWVLTEQRGAGHSTMPAQRRWRRPWPSETPTGRKRPWQSSSAPGSRAAAS